LFGTKEVAGPAKDTVRVMATRKQIPLVLFKDIDELRANLC
jgi:hypothetical protein